MRQGCWPESRGIQPGREEARAQLSPFQGLCLEYSFFCSFSFFLPFPSLHSLILILFPFQLCFLKLDTNSLPSIFLIKWQCLYRTMNFPVNTALAASTWHYELFPLLLGSKLFLTCGIIPFLNHDLSRSVLKFQMISPHPRIILMCFLNSGQTSICDLYAIHPLVLM